jgi:hypothetical protein
MGGYYNRGKKFVLGQQNQKQYGFYATGFSAKNRAQLLISLANALI